MLGWAPSAPASAGDSEHPESEEHGDGTGGTAYPKSRAMSVEHGTQILILIFSTDQYDIDQSRMQLTADLISGSVAWL
jgi:hypothetical protein